MDWQGEFLVHATLNASLVRTLHAESDNQLTMIETTPELTTAMRVIVNDGPYYMRFPQPHPLCEACRKED